MSEGTRPAKHQCFAFIHFKNCSQHSVIQTCDGKEILSMPWLQRFASTRIAWLVLMVNLLGAICYDLTTSSSWKIPQEVAAGIDTTAGEPFIWAAAAIPITFVFAVVNVAWGTAILRTRSWHSAGLWLAIIPLWSIALWIDFAHH